jgi:hypothetical protein
MLRRVRAIVVWWLWAVGRHWRLWGMMRGMSVAVWMLMVVFVWVLVRMLMRRHFLK